MENTTNVTPETTTTATVTTVKKTATKKATASKPTAKKATVVATPAVSKSVAVEAKIDTTKAVNAVAEAANEVQATSIEIKNAVVKTVNDVNKKVTSTVSDVNKKVNSTVSDVNKKVTTTVMDMNKKVTSTVNDVNKKVTDSVKKMNKEVMEAASEISTTTTKLANEMVEGLKVNERIANVKEVVANPNKYALETANNLIDNVETNTIKWQKTADKAFTTGLKLAVMQEELIFSSLEAVKTHVGTTAMRVKQLFGMDSSVAKTETTASKSTKKA